MNNENIKLNIEWVGVGTILAYEKNAKKHPAKQVEQIANSIKAFGFVQPLVLGKGNTLIVGHGRLLGAKKLGLEQVPVVRAEHLTEEEVKALRIADNKLNESKWDNQLVFEELKSLDLSGFNINLTGFDKRFVLDFGHLNERLAEVFLVPPFSVLDTRLKDWLERKKLWREVIGDEGESRESVLSGVGEIDLDTKSVMGGMAGASLLDPVLAEIVCRWFGKAGWNAFDPFAGDTVFGFVAGKTGLNFTGIELRPEQVALNQARCDKENLPATYICDTAENMGKHIMPESQDLIFTCPPYADLEVYSENPQDLSTMEHGKFFEVLSGVLAETYGKLKPNRFAVVVVSEVRGKDGTFIGLVPKTIEAMVRAGYAFYNELVLINSIGTLPMRAGRAMNATRKVGRMHQNVLVFYKGDPAEIKSNFGALVKEQNNESGNLE